MSRGRRGSSWPCDAALKFRTQRHTRRRTRFLHEGTNEVAWNVHMHALLGHWFDRGGTTLLR